MRLLFIKAITPIHVGSSIEGAADKSIQRDHLGLPIIFASSLKGALRSQIDWGADEEKIFGQKPESEEQKPGEIVFLDARPLFIPVRSFIGTYAYITSPFLLRKYADYYELRNNKSIDNKETRNSLKEIINNKIEEKLKSKENGAILLNESKLKRKILDNECKVYLNEIEFEIIRDESSKNDLSVLSEKLFLKDLELEEEPIIIVSDKYIVDLVNKSIIIYWRNRLEKDKKIVAGGSLWSEEYLPDGTVFVSGFLEIRYRSLNNNRYLDKNQENLEDKVETKLREHSIISIGGLETIGKGLVKLVVK